MRSVVVFGGYGVFGSQVCRELARRGLAVVVAGRDLLRAENLARELDSSHRALAADVTDLASCRSALEEASVAVSCAGPFSAAGGALLEACLEAACHYVDIADDRSHAARVRAWGPRFGERGLCAVYGCSSLPGLSGALALLARERAGSAPYRARVTLFIGNDNPKGPAAIRSAVEGLGRPIRAPQGVLRGFRDREVVALPPPFGLRAVYNFDSPDYDLLPSLVGVRSVSVKVGFELRPATLVFAALARLGPLYGKRTARVLAWLGRGARGLGSSGGAVVTELFWEDASVGRAALVAAEGGQRMAALPCALAAAALTSGVSARGALTAYELLGAGTLVAETERAGFSLLRP